MKNEQINIEHESLTKRIRFKSLPFDEKQMSDRLSDRVKRPVIISYTGKENSAWKYLSIAASIALLLVTGILLTDKEPEQEPVSPLNQKRRTSQKPSKSHSKHRISADYGAFLFLRLNKMKA